MCELPPLPDGWEYRLDPYTQKFYFIDHNTKSTQWKHPTAEKVYMQSDNRDAFVECPRVQNDFYHKPQKQQEPESSDVTRVATVVQKARLLQPEIENFAGSAKGKEYTRLMESLEQTILELDSVDPRGNEGVRLARKAAILEIQALMHRLDTVCQLQQPQEEPTANEIASITTNSNHGNDEQPSTLSDDNT